MANPASITKPTQLDFSGEQIQIGDTVEFIDKIHRMQSELVTFCTQLNTMVSGIESHNNSTSSNIASSNSSTAQSVAASNQQTAALVSALQASVNAFRQSSQAGDNHLSQRVHQLHAHVDGRDSQLQSQINNLKQTKITHFNSNQALPGRDIGPIWHDLYNGLMTWQVFNQNGANYTGYASVDLGQVFPSSQYQARQGYAAMGSSLPIASHPALYHRAKHLGQMVGNHRWTQGRIWYCNNNNGTFRIPDLRNIHQKFWDPQNNARGFGTYEADAVKSHGHGLIAYRPNSSSTQQEPSKDRIEYKPGNGGWVNYSKLELVDVVKATGATKNTVENVAFLGEIKL